MYAICASPLAKIFQPHLQDELIDNPAKIYEESPVEIYVPRPSGRITFNLGQPKQLSTRQSSDKEEDTLYLMHWLTGGSDGQQVQETECYGITQLDLSDNVMSLVTQAVHSSLISGKTPTMPAGVTEDIKQAKAQASVISNARVMRAVRRCWDQLQRQYEINAEAGLGKYRPSKTEILCQFVLKKEIAAEKARQAKIEAEMMETLGEAHATDSAPDPFLAEPAVQIDLSEERPAPAKRTRRTKAEMAAARAQDVKLEASDDFPISELRG